VQALCPTCYAHQAEEEKLGKRDELKLAKAGERPIDESTPTLSVFAGVKWRSRTPTSQPRSFYWEIVTHNSGPGKATKVNLGVFNEDGEQVASSSAQSLKSNGEVRMRVEYDLFSFESWKVRVKYSDVMNRRYPDLEAPLKYGSLSTLASDISRLPSR